MVAIFYRATHEAWYMQSFSLCCVSVCLSLHLCRLIVLYSPRWTSPLMLICFVISSLILQSPAFVVWLHRHKLFQFSLLLHSCLLYIFVTSCVCQLFFKEYNDDDDDDDDNDDDKVFRQLNLSTYANITRFSFQFILGPHFESQQLSDIFGIQNRRFISIHCSSLEKTHVTNIISFCLCIQFAASPHCF